MTKDFEKIVRQHTEKLAHDVADILGEDAVANADALGKAFEDFDAEMQNIAGVNHHASQVADLLVEAGARIDGKAFTRADALFYLLRNKNGAAMLNRLSKREHNSEKDTPTMTRIESFELLSKSAGFGAVAKAIVDNSGEPCISEKELSDLLKADCARRKLSFADVYSANTDEGRNIRKAFDIAKQAAYAAGVPTLAKLGPGDGWSTGGATRARTEPRTLQSLDDDAVSAELMSAPWISIQEAESRVRAAREAAQRVADRKGRQGNPQ